MGRPPNAPCHSPTRPWAPPVHYAGGLLRGTLKPHANKVRQFVLPIPPIPLATFKAIRASLAGTNQPFAVQQNRIRTLTTKFHDQRNKAAASQKRITELEDEKEQGLRDIRETRQRETADIVAVVERKLRSRYEKEAAAAFDVWKVKLDEECEAKREAWKHEQEEQVQLEPDKKRTKIEIKGNDDQTDADTGSTDDKVEKSDASKEDILEKRNDILSKKLAESEATLEKLTETRAEMIWLLKQVIKAEEKRKIDTNKKTAVASSATANNVQVRR
jgi:uncharacterized coiled-coil protein SlyX